MTITRITTPIALAAIAAGVTLAGCAGSTQVRPVRPAAESMTCQVAIATVQSVFAMSPEGLRGATLAAYKSDIAAANRACPPGDVNVRNVTLTPSELQQVTIHN